MKRIHKIGGVVAAVLVAAGLVLVMIALLMGATWRDANVGLVTVDGATGNRGSWDIHANGSLGPVRETTLQEDYTGVTDLDFDLEAAEVTITEGEKFSIRVSGSGTAFESKVVEGVWKIESEGALHSNDRHYTVAITLPRGFEAGSLDISMGMGSITADLLRGRRAELSTGMGELSVGTLYTDRATLDCGMGELTVKELYSQGADITCGMGTATIGGELLGKTTLDGSMGTILLNLSGSADQYGYTTQVGMGSITMGGDTVAGIAGSHTVGMDRANTLDITCGMGEIVVRFDQ